MRAMQAILVSLHKIAVGLHSTPVSPKSTLVAKRYIMLLAVSFILELGFLACLSLRPHEFFHCYFKMLLKVIQQLKIQALKKCQTDFL